MGAELPPCPEQNPGGRTIPGATMMSVSAFTASLAGPSVTRVRQPAPASISPRAIPVPQPSATPDLLHPAGDGERWTVLYTHSNCERLLQRACDRWAIRHYLPIVEQWCGPDRARRRASAPLLPSYVFACLSYSQRIQVLEVGHVARIIPVAHPDLLLEELRQIRDAIAGGASLTVGSALERGAWVRVVHGPLAGVIGRVEGLRRRKRRHRLVMNVSMLGRGVSTEVDASEVERVQVPGEEAAELFAEGALT